MHNKESDHSIGIAVCSYESKNSSHYVKSFIISFYHNNNSEEL